MLFRSQSPQLFNYQGVARDTAGTVLTNQPIGLQISIVADSATGTVVYTETHTTTSNDYGVFNIAIGGGSVVYGTFSGIA